MFMHVTSFTVQFSAMIERDKRVTKYLPKSAFELNFEDVQTFLF